MRTLDLQFRKNRLSKYSTSTLKLFLSQHAYRVIAVCLDFQEIQIAQSIAPEESFSLRSTSLEATYSLNNTVDLSKSIKGILKGIHANSTDGFIIKNLLLGSEEWLSKMLSSTATLDA